METTDCRNPAVDANYPSCGLICPDHLLSVQYIGQPVHMGKKPTYSRPIEHEELIQLCIFLLSMIDPDSYVTIEPADRKVTDRARNTGVNIYYSTVKKLIGDDVNMQRQ
eukprot:1244276-Amphidinium_carterae.2